MLDLQGRRSEQLVDIDSLQRLADALDDDNRRAEVAWRRCDFALGTADFPAAVDVGRLAMTLAERAGAVELGLRAQCSVTAAL